jgi:hypothetical protein
MRAPPSIVAGSLTHIEESTVETDGEEFRGQYARGRARHGVLLGSVFSMVSMRIRPVDLSDFSPADARVS